MSSKMQQPYINQTCHACSIGSFQLPKNGQEWHLECNECEATLFCYTPMPHQAFFHQDPAQYKMFAGGKKSHSPQDKKTNQIQGNPKGCIAYGNPEPS